MNNTNNDILPEDMSEGISSIAQAEVSGFRKFTGSSVFIVLCIEVVLVAFFSFTSKGLFFSASNLLTIGMNASQMMILALGITYLMTAGFWDMSIGMNIILTSTIGAKVFKMFAGTEIEIASGQYPHMLKGILLGMLAAYAVGIMGGTMNAFMISKLHLPDFVATLASMNIFRGLAMVISNGAMETGLPRAFQTYFGHAKLFNLIPYPLILALFIGIILHIMMKYTRFGLYIKALGSNKESARRAGIDVTRYCFTVYILMGVLAATAGFIDLARFATTNPSGHQTDSLMAIMAVVMGGTSLKGGIASVSGTILAALIPVTLQIGLIVIRVSTYYQLVVTGVFVVLAVYIDYRRNIKTPK